MRIATLSGLERRLLKNLGSSYAGFAVGSLITLALTPFLIGRLGAAEFGVWIVLRALLGYFQLLELGTMPAVIRHVSVHRARDEREEIEEAVAAALRILGGLALLVFPLAAAVGRFGPQLFSLPPESAPIFGTVWWILGAGAIAAFFKRLFVAVLEGHQRYDLIQACAVSLSSLSALAMVWAVLHGHGVVALLAIHVLRTAIEGAILMLLVRRDLGIRPNPLRVRRGVVRALSGYSTWAFLVDIASRISHEIDVLVIGIFLPISAVTPYEIGARLAGVAEKVTEPLVAMIFPMAAELSGAARQRALGRLFVEGTRIALLITTPVLAVLAWHGGEVIAWWVGPEYVTPALPVLWILLGAVFMAVLDATAARILLGTGQVRFDAAVSVGAAAANLVLSLALVRPLGIAGVALGTLIPATLVNLFVSVPWVCRQVGVPIHRFAAAIAIPVGGVVAGCIGGFVAVAALDREPRVALLLDALGAGALAGAALLLVWRRLRRGREAP